MRLKEAVLGLAHEGDIGATSVAELARRAGINRSTYYGHAESPIDLLVQVLSEELDEIRRHGRERFADAKFSCRQAARESYNELIDHVLRHEAIYCRPSSALFALRVVLAEHSEQTMLLVLGEGLLQGPAFGTESRSLYAAFIAHGVVGAIEAWLALPAPRDRNTLLAVVEAVAGLGAHDNEK